MWRQHSLPSRINCCPTPSSTPRGDVEVTFHPAREDGYTLYVYDKGPGFPPGFDPAKHGNTGMDLIRSLVQHDLNAQLYFENLPQGGAEVDVRLPARL